MTQVLRQVEGDGGVGRSRRPEGQRVQRPVPQRHLAAVATRCQHGTAGVPAHVERDLRSVHRHQLRLGGTTPRDRPSIALA